LEVTSVDRAFVAGEVFMVDSAAEEVCDCFLTAVGVVWEACAGSDGKVVLLGHVRSLVALRVVARRQRTSMRKGVKFFNSLVPTDLLTLAPAPSAWSIASNTLRILRGVVVVAVKEGSLGGMTGRPLKVDCAGAIVVFVVA
jgi:hypothetical protein